MLNTIFLVREIRRNEQHDAFINAVTHELKTPVASMQLYLQTLQTPRVDEAKRQEFYRVMLEDSDRLLRTIEQVLRAGQHRRASCAVLHQMPVDLCAQLVQECLDARADAPSPAAEALTLPRGAPTAPHARCSATKTS